MPKSTPATLALRKLGIAFKLHSYIYDSTIPSGGIGLQAAEALGVEPGRVLKTLMAEVDGQPVCVVVPSDCEVSMKKLAAALGGKSANMMRPADNAGPEWSPGLAHRHGFLGSINGADALGLCVHCHSGAVRSTEPGISRF